METILIVVVAIILLGFLLFCISPILIGLLFFIEILADLFKKDTRA